IHILLLHARVDSAVFLFALLDVPTRQAIFDLAVRPRVLLEHRDSNSVIRQNFRRHRARNRTANYRHEMMPRIRHLSAPQRTGADCTTRRQKFRGANIFRERSSASWANDPAPPATVGARDTRARPTPPTAPHPKISVRFAHS